MTSYNTDGKVGPWAFQKLECLGKYLAAYATIMRKQDWCSGYYYLDAFAGCGISEVRKPSSAKTSQDNLYSLLMQETIQDESSREYLEGSPFVALQSEPEFSEYYFVEQDTDRRTQLEESLSEFRETRNFHVIPGEAARILERFVLSEKFNWKTNRAVVFLDPFGMQVQWDTISKLADTGAIEVLINFPVGMGIQRLLPKGGVVPERRALLNEYFGTNDWEQVLYDTSTDLFGEENTKKIEQSGQRLAIWYRERLQEIFGFSATPRLVRNTKGGHLYYLLFAGPNKKGVEIADYILNQGETI